MNKKTVKFILVLFLLIVLLFSFMKCSSTGGFGSAQTEESTSEAIDISTMPANSEFLNEESE